MNADDGQLQAGERRGGSMARAIVYAMLVPPLCAVALMLVGASEWPPAELIATLCLMVGLMAVVSAIVLAVAGVPYVLWLQSRGRLNPLWICLGAALIGALAFFVVTYPFSRVRDVETAWRTLLQGGGFGLLSGIAFCAGLRLPWFARRDRTASSSPGSD